MIKVLKKIYLGLKFDGSKNYWDNRYSKGGNSGAGSYGRLAEFKAETLNKFVAEHNVNSVLEFGVGDGNQLSLAKYPNYVGLDVSKTAIKWCINKFKDDSNKSFFIYDPDCFKDAFGVFNVDLAMSLDVIYHLVEDNVFEKYMYDLFRSSRKWVIIYSSDTEENYFGHHVRQRAFTKWVDKNIKNWELKTKLPNKFPFELGNPETSFADFYIYERKV